MTLFRVINNDLNLRKEPTFDGEIVEVLARNTRLEKFGESPDGYWYQVRHETATETKEGWASHKYLEPLPTIDTNRALTNSRFNTARRRAYVSAIMHETEAGTGSRFDFFRPSRQTWDKGQWYHGYELDGQHFMVAADWKQSQDKGRLVITQPTKSISAVAFNKAFGGSDQATYCNYNVSYCYQIAYGGTNLQDTNGSLAGGERTANGLNDHLSGNWSELKAVEAAAIANAGGFVVAARKNPGGHGHVVFLLEGSPGDQGVGGLNCFHVGGGLPRETTIQNAFGTPKGVRLFADTATYREWFSIVEAGLEEAVGDVDDAIAEFEALEPFTIETNLKRRRSILGAAEIEALMVGKRKGLAGIGAAVAAAGRKYGINTAYIVAHAALESDWGKSNIAIQKNNLFGWGAFDNTPFASAGKFPSRDVCIDFVMGRINELYLKPTGTYFRKSPCLGSRPPGPSFGMNANYASDPNWARQIASIADQLENEA